MLTQELVKYQKPTKSVRVGKKKFRAGSPEHREAILSGVLDNAASKGFFEGARVKTVHKPYRQGVIIRVMMDILDAHWSDFKCQPIEVFFYEEDGSTYMFHPNDLKEA